jgi:CheY-like chemotaxis protein
MPDSKLVVLVADDHADGREMITDIFELAGHRVVPVEDGAAAIAAACSASPDVVILDLAMPGLDGAETSRRLKSDARTSHIPVAILTAHHSDEAQERARGCGADIVLIKPLPPADLLEAIRSLLRPR